MKRSLLIDLLDSLSTGTPLDPAHCASAVAALLDPDINDQDKAKFLTAQMARGVFSAELVAFAQAILPFSVPVGFQQQWQGQDLLDCCGTGGGGLNILNISTGAAFILAAAGVPVVKHGNRGVTKKSGSADVLEALGLRIDLAPDELQKSLDQLGWAFVYAPRYHPAFQAVGAVRRQLGAQGQKTIFNFLGPLLNPCRPAAQLVGVFQAEHLGLYHDALTTLGCRKVGVVQGFVASQPIGEVGVQSNFSNPAIAFTPPITVDSLEELRVTDAAESAQRLVAILRNEEQGLARDLLLANAAVGLTLQGRVATVPEAWKIATELLDQGAAYAVLTKAQELFPIAK